MIPTPEQVAEIKALLERGWRWDGIRTLPLFIPGFDATIDLYPDGWRAKVGALRSPVGTAKEAADWAAAELRRVAMQSPIFEGVVEAKWQMAKPKVWMLCIGKFPVVSVLILRSTIQMNVNSNEYIYQSSEALNAEIARRGLPPLPADAWEAE